MAAKTTLHRQHPLSSLSEVGPQLGAHNSEPWCADAKSLLWCVVLSGTSIMTAQAKSSRCEPCVLPTGRNGNTKTCNENRAPCLFQPQFVLPRDPATLMWEGSARGAEIRQPTSVDVDSAKLHIASSTTHRKTMGEGGNPAEGTRWVLLHRQGVRSVTTKARVECDAKTQRELPTIRDIDTVCCLRHTYSEGDARCGSNKVVEARGCDDKVRASAPRAVLLHFQTLHVPSSLPVLTALPSKEKATAETVPRWPRKGAQAHPIARA